MFSRRFKQQVSAFPFYFFCICITTVCICISFTNLCMFCSFFFTVFMAQSRAAGRGQTKGKNVTIGDAPPPPIPSKSATSNVKGRLPPKGNIEKYPLWKYVTREDGPSSKGKGGSNVNWRCNFCNNTFTSTYYRVKGHLLALPGCGVGACTQVSYKRGNKWNKSSLLVWQMWLQNKK